MCNSDSEPRWLAYMKVRSKQERSLIRHNRTMRSANELLPQIVEECGSSSFTFDDLIDCLGSHSNEALAQQRNRELKIAFNNLLERELIVEVESGAYEVTLEGRIRLEDVPYGFSESDYK